MHYNIFSSPAQKTILDNIKRLRQQKSLSSKEMANKIGISQSDYSKIEKGKKKCWIKYINKIAEALNTDKNKLCINLNDEILIENIKNEELLKIIEKQRYIYIELFNKLDELDKQKDDKIIELENEIIRLNALISELKSEVKRLRDLLNGNEPENLLPIHQNISKYRERERESKMY